MRTVFWAELASRSCYSQLSEAELAKSSLLLFLWTVTGSMLFKLSLGFRNGFWKLFFLSLVLVETVVRSETKWQGGTKVSKLSSIFKRLSITYKEKLLIKEHELHPETQALSYFFPTFDFIVIFDQFDCNMRHFRPGMSFELSLKLQQVPLR